MQKTTTPNEQDTRAIWWECLHCEQQIKSFLKPLKCDCQHNDFKLCPPPINDPNSPQYLKAVFNNNKAEGREVIAKHLLKQFHFKTIADSRANTIWVYRDGIYEPIGKKVIEEQVERILGSLATNSQRNEVVGKIAVKTFIERRELKQTNPYLVCARNGVLNLLTNELTPQDPTLLFLKKIPVSYKPEADCPKIKEFLKQILDSGEESNDMRTLEEFIGYTLYDEYKYKKALLLLGPRDTGKTTLIKLLTSFVGEDNIAGESLHHILKNKYSAYNLIGKYANFYDDLSTRDFSDVGNFKIATGGGYIRAERKFEDAFQYKNKAKHCFATNEVALPKETVDDAYYSRWLVIRFLNQFNEGNEKTNKNLINELTTDTELSGLLNLALEGFQRLEKNQSFSYNLTPDQIKQIMHESGDSITAFALNCLENKTNALISKDDMYNIFLDWCKLNKRSSVSKDMLSKKLKLAAIYLREGSRKYAGKKTRCWIHVQLNSNTSSTFSKHISSSSLLSTSSKFHDENKDVTGVTPSSNSLEIQHFDYSGGGES